MLKMTLRPVKTVIVFLLGFFLAWQGVFAERSDLVSGAQVSKRSCCVKSCDKSDCPTPACCAKREAPSVPVSLPVSSPTELYAVEMKSLAWLPQPERPRYDLPTRTPRACSVTAIPLFKRDCCYLL